MEAQKKIFSEPKDGPSFGEWYIRADLVEKLIVLASALVRTESHAKRLTEVLKEME